ncbi:MAG: hypothetical protein KG075_23860 [Alphaproteobacteria bacterium]|nr:hypothetical protein [Alphaproteobacteria bacterium]
MADIIDQANDTADLFLRSSLLKRQQSAKDPPSGIGMCLSCGEDVEGERRWCDAGCRDDWQRRQKRGA